MDGEVLMKLLKSNFLGTPCRVCGRRIKKDDLSSLGFAGLSEVYPGVRVMHGRCFEGLMDILLDRNFFEAVEKFNMNKDD